MQPADECLDPALMGAFAENPFGQTQWRCAEADAGPPSPFDLSTIDPDLLALYPEHKDNSSTRSRVPDDGQNLSLSPPPLREKSSALSMTSDLTTGNAEIRTLRPGTVEERADDEAASHAARSESPPPIWIPPRTSTSLPDAPPLTSSTTTDARDARSSASPAHPRLIIRNPSLATQQKTPGAKSAPPVPPALSQKRARSPTPDSEEDDFAASFMRKRRVLAGLL